MRNSLSVKVVGEYSQGSEITYIINIVNSGNPPADATDNVVITDAFDPALSGITVTYNGVTWTTPSNYTYNEETGLFRTVLGTITVPAATFTRDSETGAWVTNPGSVTITVTGTI